MSLKYGYTRNLKGALPIHVDIKIATATAVNPGDILCYAGGYWARVTAATDYDKPIAIAACYKAADTDLAGYYNAIIPTEYDVFLYPLDAASSSVDFGTQIKPYNHNAVATTSGGTQKFAVAVSTSQIPKSGTTLGTISVVEIVFKASGAII